MKENNTDSETNDNRSKFTRRQLLAIGGTIGGIFAAIVAVLQFPFIIRKYLEIFSGWFNSDQSDTPTPRPPDAHINIEPENPDPGQEVLLDGTGSFAPDGEIERYRWLINTFPQGTRVAEKCCEAKETHTFERGNYEISLTVTDSNNNHDSEVLSISVGGDTFP